MGIGLILWALGSLIVALYGNDRRLGFWGTLIASLFLSPLLVFLLLYASEDLSRKQRPKQS